MSVRPTAPGDLRPAQLGVVLLGRVILGHVAATLVDLGQWGFLRIDEVRDDDDHDWLLTDLRGQAGTGRSLLRFEQTLLNGMFARQSAARVGEISQDLIPALNRMRRQLYRDAVRRGWLRRWHPGRRTPRGELLLKEIQSFRRELRALATSGDSATMAQLAPYAIVFGLGGSPAVRLQAQDTERAQRRQSSVQWSQSDRFATSWLAVCGGLPHAAGDFVQQWSAPREHGPGSHGHGLGHGGYGGGHESFGGGHHGGAAL